MTTIKPLDVEVPASKCRFRMTIIEAPNPVSKRFDVNAEGSVEKHPAKPIGKAAGRTVETTLEKLPALLKNFTSNQALVMGVPVNGTKEFDLTTVGNPIPGKIPRNRDNFKFNNLALLPLDYDLGDFKETSEFDDAMERILPGYKKLERVYRQSNTGAVYRNENPIFKDLKFHGYILARLDPERAVEQLQGLKEIIKVRSWNSGTGYLFISKSGSVEERCIIDLAPIARPEALMYEGQPTLGEGLTCQLPKCTHIPGETPYLDVAAIEPLSMAEKEMFGKRVKDERNRRLPGINAARAAFNRKMVTELVESKQVTHQEAEKNVRHAMNDTLLPSWSVHLDDGRHLTVKDLLADNREFDGVTMADPLEPDYGGGRCKAKFFWNDGSPIIFSHAHGGRTFRLVNEPASEPPPVELAIEKGGYDVAVFSLEQIYTQIIEERPIAKGYSYEEEQVVVHAPGGLGKSLLEHDCAMNYGSGVLSLWDRFPIPRYRTTLFVQSENGRLAVHQRTQKKCLGNRAFIKGLGNIFYAGEGESIQLVGHVSEPSFREKVYEAAKRTSVHLDRIVFDPLISYHDADENDNSRMRTTLDYIAEIGNRIGATPTVIHHDNRNNEIRGASAIRDWARSVIKLESAGERRIKLIHEKCNNAELFKPFLLEMDGFLNFVPFEMVDVMNNKQRERCEAVKHALILQGSAVDTQGALIEQYLEHTGLKNETTARRHVNEAVKNGFIMCEYYEEDGIKKCKYHL